MRQRRTGAASAGLVPGALHWASVRFPPENGEDPVSVVDGSNGIHGMLRLASSNALFGTPWLATSGALVVVTTVEHLIWNGISVTPHVAGTTVAGPGIHRAFSLRYIVAAQGAADMDRFVFAARGEVAASAWTGEIKSAPLPSATGRVLVALRFDGADFRIDLWDCDSGTKLAGESLPKPAGWAGIAQVTNDLAIGGVNPQAFPRMSEGAATSITAWRGEIGFLALLDADPADSALQAAALGMDPEAAFGLENCRLLARLTSDGALDPVVRSNRPAVDGSSLAVLGTLLPGSSLRRQSGSAWFMLDRLPDPVIVAARPGETLHSLRVSFRLGGTAGGPIAVRIQDEDGAILMPDWQPVATASGASASATVLLPWHPQGRFWRLTFRVPDGAGGFLHAHHNADVVVAHAGLHLGQSEMAMVLGGDVNRFGLGGNALGLDYAGGVGRRVFRTDFNNLVSRPMMTRSQFNLRRAGSGQIVMANMIGAASVQPICFVRGTVPGTSPLSLIRDSDQGRRWSDLELSLDAMGWRDGAGRARVSALVSMWEEFTNIADVPGLAWPPLYAGQDSAIAWGPRAEEIDHFIYDGVTLEPDFLSILMPANRRAHTALSSATVDNNPIEADQRLAMRESARLRTVHPRIRLGPECAVHDLADGTHPSQLAGGIGPWARAVGRAWCQAFGLAPYDGPFEFTAYQWENGSGPGPAVIATINADDGALDTEGNAHADWYGDAPAAPVGLAVEGWEWFDPASGAWSRAGISATIASARKVRIVRDSGSFPPGTRFRFHPGGPGAYAGMVGGTPDELLWIKRAPVWNGFEVAGGNQDFGVTAGDPPSAALLTETGQRLLSEDDNLIIVE
ncbi:MAG TPA: hypothetical protein PKD92_03915 [Novosphingobium sp.]|nr:hypothetical protein [Novosphingobium sp.]